MCNHLILKYHAPFPRKSSYGAHATRQHRLLSAAVWLLKASAMPPWLSPRDTQPSDTEGIRTTIYAKLLQGKGFESDYELIELNLPPLARNKFSLRTFGSISSNNFKVDLLINTLIWIKDLSLLIRHHTITAKRFPENTAGVLWLLKLDVKFKPN